MYKIGDKLKCTSTISGICKFTANEIYEIATQRQQDKKYVIFDDNNEPAYFDDIEIEWFDLIDKETLFIQECTNFEHDNKAKNPNSKHYELWENFEAIDVIKLALTDEEYKGFLKGNILKYRLRAGKKNIENDNIIKDINKSIDYERELNK